MVGLPSPFSTGESPFDPEGSFVPEHLPAPGEFLTGATVLTGEDHAAVHSTARELFERRGVYDVTFDYNLARLNLDRRHESAGYRYAEETDAVLRAEFTPTTPFCPQSRTLAVGSFRAWNGLSGGHDYDLVRIRVRNHHRESGINDQLRRLERQFRSTGRLPAAAPFDGEGDDGSGGAAGTGAGAGPGRGPQAPF